MDLSSKLPSVVGRSDMTKKEKAIQKALGTTPKAFQAYGSMDIPVQITIAIPFTIDVKAISPEDAKRVINEKLSAMTNEQRKRFVFKNCDQETFAEANETSPSDIWADAEKAKPIEFSMANITIEDVDGDGSDEDE